MATTSKLQEFLAEKLAEREDLNDFISAGIEKLVSRYAEHVGADEADFSVLQNGTKFGFKSLTLSGTVIDFTLRYSASIDDQKYQLSVDLCATRLVYMDGDAEVQLSLRGGSELLTDPDEINNLLDSRFLADIESQVFPVI